MSEVFNISNKYRLSNKSANKLLFTQDTLQHSFIFKKSFVLNRRNFKKHPLFNTFLLFFKVDEVCIISNKYQPPVNIPKHQNFYRKHLTSILDFQKKLALSIASVFRIIHFLPHFHFF